MQIKLFNTLTRKKEVFKPIEKNRVGIYVCGPTVYDFAHIGNLSSYLRWDILRRIFEYNNYQIKAVMNITDVDDKTIRNSQKHKIVLKEFTQKYTKLFFDDMKSLNIKSVEVYPKATGHIKEMVELVKKLLEKGIAYKAKDGIYFNISKFKNYGKLSRIDLQNLKIGASCRIKSDEYNKKNINDFVLWKFWDKSDEEVYWQTEIGKGRPGWHIECSAMSTKYLGQPFDIHTGAVDLIFPHHENEIAQSEASIDKKFVNYWLHCEHLLVSHKKMAKSDNNFYTLKDITEKGYNPLAFRYLVLSSHYQKKLNFTWESMNAAQNALDRLCRETEKLKSKETKKQKNKEAKKQRSKKTMEKYQKKFLESINDNMNMPKVLAIVWDLIKSDEKDQDKYVTLLDFDRVLGLGLDQIREEKIPEKIMKKAKEMDEARENGDYNIADKLRKEIEKSGYSVENTKKGSKIYKK